MLVGKAPGSARAQPYPPGPPPPPPLPGRAPPRARPSSSAAEDRTAEAPLTPPGRDDMTEVADECMLPGSPTLLH